MRSTLTTLLLVSACVCLTPRPAASADAWIEASSPHFVVISNAGEKRARDVAWQLEQGRRAQFVELLFVLPPRRADQSRRRGCANDDDDADAAQQSDNVERRLSPAFSFKATVLLGFNRAGESLGFALRSVTLDPGVSSSWLVLGRVYDRLKQTGDARLAGQRAKGLAQTDAERSAADAFLEALGRPWKFQSARVSGPAWRRERCRS